MKFCYKCGEQLRDDAEFCSKCGTPLNEKMTSVHKNNEGNAEPDRKNIPLTENKHKTRKGMKVFAIICFVFAGIYGLLGLIEAMIFSMAVLFVVLGLMFLVLAKSPKGNKYILGKNSGVDKLRFVLCSILLAFTLCFMFMVISVIDETSVSNEISDPTENGTATTEVNINPHDVTRFANITSEQLVAICGEPNKKENGNCVGSFEIPCLNYEYDNLENYGSVTFVLVKDKVVRFTSYNEYTCSNFKKVLENFGVQESDGCTTVVNNDTALRYRCPSDSIDDFWISIIDKENDSFGFLQVTYDMEYYDEWYLPTSLEERSNYMYLTEETVKQLLKAPKTADFASINSWNFVKNKFYIGVGSYVDAQNSFGANIRSEFTFIYEINGGLVYAVFDGEVIWNKGYVKTEELVKKQLNENS